MSMLIATMAVPFKKEERSSMKEVIKNGVVRVKTGVTTSELGRIDSLRVSEIVEMKVASILFQLAQDGYQTGGIGEVEGEMSSLIQMVFKKDENIVLTPEQAKGKAKQLIQTALLRARQ
jgi:hypothetical protein